MEKLLAQKLTEFIFKSPTSYHAVYHTEKEVISNGFKRPYPEDTWQIEQGGRYYVTQNHSSIFAFEIGNGDISEGIMLICAHSDSPTLRIKPNAEITVEGKYLKLNTEVYQKLLHHSDTSLHKHNKVYSPLPL